MRMRNSAQFWIKKTAWERVDSLLPREIESTKPPRGRRWLSIFIQSLDFNSIGHEPSASDVRVSLEDYYRGYPDVAHAPCYHDGVIIRGTMQFVA